MIWDRASTRRVAIWVLPWRIVALALVLFVPALVAAAVAQAQPGPLRVEAVAIQQDGKIVAAGTRDLGEGNFAFAVARYDHSGSPDTAFGDGGVVTTDFGIGDDSARALVIQPDAKIVVAGRGSSGTFALARYNVDGSLDSGFGIGGKVETSFGGFFDQASDVAIQDDGKLVAAGSHDEFGGAVSHVALARYEADGALDPSFGIGGRVTTMIEFAFATSLTIQRDGNLVAAGVAGRFDSGRFALFRLTTHGFLDLTFGDGGIVRTAFRPEDFQIANDVVVQRNGRIVAAGLRESADFNTDFALARYTSDGTLDPQFGDGGKVTTDFGGREGVNAIALQRDGRLIAGGTYIVRYDREGALDPSFGANGVVDRSAESVAIQPDRKIVAVGGTELARLNHDGSLDPSFGNGGVAPAS